MSITDLPVPIKSLRNREMSSWFIAESKVFSGHGKSGSAMFPGPSVVAGINKDPS